MESAEYNYLIDTDILGLILSAYKAYAFLYDIGN